MKLIKKGVPQGSILGPDLFKIYIDDIARLNLKGSLQLFADDAVIKYSTDTETELNEAIQNDLSCIEDWLERNKMSLNIKKSKILIFENKVVNFQNIKYKNNDIGIVKSFNYLGLIIDSKLKWQQHIDHVVKKIIPYVFILKRLRKYICANTY